MARPLYAASFGVSIVLVGLISSLSAGPRMISGPITGYLADRWGRRPMIFVGAITHGLVLVAQSMTTSYTQYALLEVVAGLGIAFWTISSGVLIADITGVDNRGRGVAIRNTAQRLGMLAGPLMGGVITAAFGLRWVFIFIASTKVVVLLVTLFLIPETKPLRKDQPKPARNPQLPMRRLEFGMFTTKAFGALVAAALAFGMIGVGPGVFRTYFPIHAQTAAGLSPATIGSLFSVAALITLLLALPTGMLLDRYGRRWLILFGLAVTAIATYLLGATGGFATALATMLVFALAEGINSNTIQTYAMDLAPPEKRGVFLGVYHMTMNTGQVIGPLGAGLAAELLGLEVALYLFAGIVAVCAMLFIALAPETLKRKPVP